MVKTQKPYHKVRKEMRHVIIAGDLENRENNEHLITFNFNDARFLTS
jgi:hypothetical protein